MRSQSSARTFYEVKSVATLMTLDSLLCTEVVRDVSFPVYKKNLIVILLMRHIVLENGEFTLLSYALIAKLYRGMLCSMM